MLIHVRGLKIHAKSGKGGVVNLVVGADQKHTGVLRRLRQHLANALFRAGDLCNPGHQGRTIRVVKFPMGTDPINDATPQGTGANVDEVWPLNLPNGDAYYNALLLHESVKRHHNCRWLSILTRRWRKKGTDDSCSQLLSPVSLSEELVNVTKVIVMPDSDSITT